MPKFLHIRSAKFPVLPGEDDELFNEGTHGKAFAMYLQDALTQHGYNCPSYCCEDWGWWVAVRLPTKAIGLCCYRLGPDDGTCDLVCSPSPQKDLVWSWSKLRFIDLRDELEVLIASLVKVFEDDADIDFIAVHDEFPF